MKFSGASCLYFLLQIFNFAIFLLGIALLASAAYLWMKVGLLNSFILSIAVLALFMLVVSLYGYCCTEKSPCAIIIYQLFLIVLVIFIAMVVFFIYSDQDKIVEVLTANLTDSADTILQLKVDINRNMDLTKVGLLIYAVVVVSTINIFTNYLIVDYFFINILLLQNCFVIKIRRQGRTFNRESLTLF